MLKPLRKPFYSKYGMKMIDKQYYNFIAFDFV